MTGRTSSRSPGAPCARSQLTTHAVVCAAAAAAAPQLLSIDDVEIAVEERAVDMVALETALDRLRGFDHEPRGSSTGVSSLAARSTRSPSSPDFQPVHSSAAGGQRAPSSTRNCPARTSPDEPSGDRRRTLPPGATTVRSRGGAGAASVPFGSKRLRTPTRPWWRRSASCCQRTWARSFLSNPQDHLLPPQRRR